MQNKKQYTINRKMQYTLYVLKLQQGKYYVGITTKTPEIRMQEHKDGVRGASWTQRYKPLKIIDSRVLGEISKIEAETYENKVVRAYMNKYGYNNVRGGDLRSPEKFIKRFGWYRSAEGWETVCVVFFFLLLLLISLLLGKLNLI